MAGASLRWCHNGACHFGRSSGPSVETKQCRVLWGQPSCLRFRHQVSGARGFLADRRSRRPGGRITRQCAPPAAVAVASPVRTSSCSRLAREHDLSRFRCWISFVGVFSKAGAESTVERHGRMRRAPKRSSRRKRKASLPPIELRSKRSSVAAFVLSGGGIRSASLRSGLPGLGRGGIAGPLPIYLERLRQRLRCVCAAMMMVTRARDQRLEAR